MLRLLVGTVRSTNQTDEQHRMPNDLAMFRAHVHHCCTTITMTLVHLAAPHLGSRKLLKKCQRTCNGGSFVEMVMQTCSGVPSKIYY